MTDLAHLHALDALLSTAMQSNASDIILVAGSPTTLRVNGALRSDAGPALTDSDVQNLLLPLLTPAQTQQLHALKCLDLCFVNEGVGRIRANLHFQRGTLAAAIRLLPAEVPTFKSLNLPEQLATLAERRQGLILLTGATGCGKSSTMAALVNQINSSRQDHIITIEDPVEFEHLNQQSQVEQIELGMDANSFAEAVRSVWRQDPDVILIGEVRDSDTMVAAMTAAETGHLVLTSMHTNDAAQTIGRILDIFPSN